MIGIVVYRRSSRSSALSDELVVDDGSNAVVSPVGGKTIDELAHEVIAGDWGNDPERSARLTAAGYNAVAVQQRVNELMKQ